MASRKRSGQQLAAENHEIMYRRTTEGCGAVGGRMPIESERKWERGSDGALARLSKFLSEAGFKGRGCFGASRTLHILASPGTERRFMLGLTANRP